MPDVIANLQTMSPAAMLLVAILFNLLFCSTTRVSRLFSLPMSMAGGMIATLERRYNRSYVTDRMRRSDSFSIALLLAMLGLLLGFGAELLLVTLPFGWVPVSMIIGTLLGARALLERNRLLIAAMSRSEDEAKATLTYLTGRDAERLDRHGIAGAGVESLAMTLTQGLFAPIALFLLAGLPALLTFKLLDTASIMIDERSENARSFGVAPRAFAGILLRPFALGLAALIVPLCLIIPRASAMRAAAGLFRRERYAWPTFSAPVRVLAYGLGITLGGPVCVGHYERSGDQINPQGGAADSTDLKRSRIIAFTFILSVTLMLGLIAFLGLTYPIRLIPQ